MTTCCESCFSSLNCEIIIQQEFNQQNRAFRFSMKKNAFCMQIGKLINV